MPLLEIVRAAEAHRADIVALSFSVAFAQRKVPAVLQQLRDLLPAHVDVWAGGRGASRLGAVPGVRRIATLDEAVVAVGDWSSSRSQAG